MLTTKQHSQSNKETFILFNETSGVRRERYEDERYYSVVDIVTILTGSKDWRNYRYVLKQRLSQEWTEVLTKCKKLKIVGGDGKKYPTDTWNTETILRIIQSIPSPNAEPLKRRLASLGNEKFQEMNDPELWLVRARERAILAYKAKWRTDDQIKARLQSIDGRHKYTDELKNRGITKGAEYAFLTDKGYSWTGMNTKQLKEFKGLKKHHNLRDNMNTMELLLTGVQEETTRELMIDQDAQGFNDVDECVEKGAKVAKKTRENIEELTWKSVIKKTNNLREKQDKYGLK